MNMIPDVLFLIIIAAAFAFGWKKGFIQSIWKIAALVITIVAVIGLKDYAVNFIKNTAIADNIGSFISEKLQIAQGGGVNITESLHMPDLMQSQLSSAMQTAGSAADTINKTAALSLTGIVITIGVCILLFIAVRLILMALYMIVNAASKAPVINGTNRLLGGVLAVVNMLFIVFLLLAAFTMLAPANSGLYEMIDKSYIVGFLYNNNVLLKLFIK